MPNDISTDPILWPVFQYWRNKCGARAIPRRRDIDPTEMPHAVLPHLQLVELIDGGKRARFRLVGTKIVEAFGDEFTGKYIDEVFSGERLKFVEASYLLLCESKRPVLVRRRFVIRSVPLNSYRLLLPLSEDGVTVDQCLGAVRFESSSHARDWIGTFGTLSVIDLAASVREVVA
ncbi:MAG: PAS domain-containing protein [Alphaproteobacteria bacterium]|nr:PAS domain-containing protein [Alphaproteobacteria bacterium]